jgi:hypothetical protein
LDSSFPLLIFQKLYLSLIDGINDSTVMHVLSQYTSLHPPITSNSISINATTTTTTTTSTTAQTITTNNNQNTTTRKSNGRRQQSK